MSKPQKLRKTVNIDATSHDKLGELLGPTRKVQGALEALIDWLGEQSGDLVAAIVDRNASADTTADVLERLADRARVRAGRPSFRDAARLILQHAAETGPSSVLREMSFDEMSTLTKTLAELMAERGKLL